jgi:hypothetical protein
VRLAAPIVLLGACAGASVYACGSARSHIYAGELYHADRDCVDNTSAIDVVDGPEPANCAPTCLAAPTADDGGRGALYVSSMCAPFPPSLDSSGNAPGCANALAAAARNDTCTGDAGSTNPLPHDAGAE